ncbi:MAG: selenium cofactor biosynthesis protein YqeC [Chloroflexota bacterium]
MKLHEAFRIVRGDVVAFIGAGGKTSTMVALAHELADKGWRVLVTTTTRIGRDELDLMPIALAADAPAETISAALAQPGFVFLYGDIGEQKVQGIAPDAVAGMLDRVDSDVMLIEADGARGLLLKAPYGHEPVIPTEALLVVPVVSMDVLGQPLDETHVYNAAGIDAKYGFGLGNRIKSPWVAQVMRDRDLMMRGVPDHARVIGLVNGVPSSGYLLGRGRLIAQLALRVRDDVRGREREDYRRYDGVALANVRGANPVHEVQRALGAVVLAAGMAKRMGQMKVLLPWADGRTIIQHIVRQLTLARLDIESVVVVTGNEAEAVERVLDGTGVRLVHNPLFATGEMLSSLKVGLESMPDHVSAALVVLGDQPRIQARTVGLVGQAYAENAGRIVAPSFEMRRGHPILIDRMYWREILELPFDGAPRDVINAHQNQVAYVLVDNDSVLQDVDTPTAYREARRKAGLD